MLVFDFTPAAVFGIWVSQTKLEYFGIDSEGFFPQSNLDFPFPFVKLAAVSPADSTKIYLSHQLNDDTLFLEEQWDQTLGIWRSSNIGISI